MQFLTQKRDCTGVKSAGRGAELILGGIVVRDTGRQKSSEEIDRIYVEAGARILKCRTDKKLSRNSLAKAAGISSKFLYEIESGHTGFTVGVLERLANALRVDSDYILHGRLARQNCDEDLIKAISAFDEEKLQKLVPVLNILAEFK